LHQVVTRASHVQVAQAELTETHFDYCKKEQKKKKQNSRALYRLLIYSSFSSLNVEAKDTTQYLVTSVHCEGLFVRKIKC